MKGKVGPFFYLSDRIICDTIDIDWAEDCGGQVTWGSHSILWNQLCKTEPELKNKDYYSYPRGRVAYKRVEQIYCINITPELNNDEIIRSVILQYNLEGEKVLVDDMDKRYQIASSVTDLL